MRRVAGARRGRSVDQGRVDDRGAAHVGDAILADQFEDFWRIDLAQANVDAACGRKRPWEAPAVTVEHRQRPEINRALAEISGDDVADSVEIGAAMMGDDALWIAGRAGGVAERNRVPFVLRQRPGEFRIALRDPGFVFDRTDPFAAAE